MELCHKNLDILERVLSRIALPKYSTVRKCIPMQIIKQPEYGQEIIQTKMEVGI